jgi:hypothetical protein
MNPTRLLAATLLTVALTSDARADDKRVPDRDVKDWVRRRVADWQPTADERRFDDVAWVADIRTALKLAKDHDRPVFLFTHDGHIDVGRC